MNIAYFLLPLIFVSATSAARDDPIEELPAPHIIILGATGVGKSSLANVFIGEDPTCEDCTFPVCSGADSCTKDTTYAVKPWLGEGQEITVVDTPGFGDSDKEDSVLIDEMMGVLKNTVKSASVLLLVLDGNQDRFSESLQQMLREMRALFGDSMWNNVLIGISKWPFDESSVNLRNKTCVMTPKQCRDEAHFSSSMMNAIEEKFHVGRNLTFAFIDSWAKHPMNIDDQVQQAAFNRESAILWNFAATAEEFAFKSIQLKKENAYLRGVLESNITEILQVQQELAEEMTNLQIHQGHTSESLAKLDEKTTAAIANFDLAVQDLGQNIQQNAQNIATNANSILALGESIVAVNNSLSLLETLPLGTIVAWNELDADSHPLNWVECDGREIQDGPWKGKLTPDINNSKRFLRGGTVGEAFELEEDAFQEHYHEHTHTYSDVWPSYKAGADPEETAFRVYVDSATEVRTTDGAIQGRIVAADRESLARIAGETRPKNIKVVFLMKCWHIRK